MLGPSGLGKGCGLGSALGPQEQEGRGGGMGALHGSHPAGGQAGFTA